MITDKGYRMINGVYEHRLIYYTKYPITPREYHVHHIDHNKLNNDISNLIAIPEKLHAMVHLRAKIQGFYLSREQIMELWDLVKESIDKPTKQKHFHKLMNQKPKQIKSRMISKGQIKEYKRLIRETDTLFKDYNLEHICPNQYHGLYWYHNKATKAKKRQEANRIKKLLSISNTDIKS